ncbi:hypothetical protein NQ317_007049 [Molorchus minor]|uniref:Uncharacterized protein n=1 Tax=Molorchus minor TaxID=1323400 RepID=A0ABQ9K4L7_9CUCU|nr:hypothetical protein NQ317_007049 [Molorchus minor]
MNKEYNTLILVSQNYLSRFIGIKSFSDVDVDNNDTSLPLSSSLSFSEQLYICLTASEEDIIFIVSQTSRCKDSNMFIGTGFEIIHTNKISGAAMETLLIQTLLIYYRFVLVALVLRTNYYSCARS